MISPEHKYSRPPLPRTVLVYLPVLGSLGSIFHCFLLAGHLRKCGELHKIRSTKMKTHNLFEQKLRLCLLLQQVFCDTSPNILTHVLILHQTIQIIFIVESWVDRLQYSCPSGNFRFCLSIFTGIFTHQILGIAQNDNSF